MDEETYNGAQVIGAVKGLVTDLGYPQMGRYGTQRIAVYVELEDGSTRPITAVRSYGDALYLYAGLTAEGEGD